MKRENRVNALYASLTNKERAILAFQSIAEGDKEEAQRIAATVPLKRYVCADVEYERWYDAIWALADAYAIEYWRLTVWTYRYSQRARYLEAQNDPEGAERASQSFAETYERLSALDVALDAVCAESNVDAVLVRKAGGIGDEIPTPDAWADAEQMYQYKQRFSSLFVRE